MVLERLALIKTALPPIDNDPPCHASSFFPNFSNLLQSDTFSLLADIGTPKYLIGKAPIWLKLKYIKNTPICLIKPKII
jgi:hypothetical protein